MAVKVCIRGDKELSRNKKSIFLPNFSNMSVGTIFVLSIIVISVGAADTDISCANVKNIFENKGMLSLVDIQVAAESNGGGLCSNRGCCGEGARARLTSQARSQLEGSLRSELAKLSDVLSNRAKRFDEFFRRLLQQSREEFHAMFKRTYGMIYEQHSYVFEQLFEQLERYYARGDSDLVRLIDHFFGVLYQKMFTVLNSQYSFDDKYLKCVADHMRETQPFEDVPHKLSVQLRRAFVATRTFHKALKAGADIVRAMSQVGVSSECGAAWAKLRWCGTCGGLGDSVPACSRYCHNVLRGCLPTHADLAHHWDAYVDAVDKVADRLLGPFNIVMVVEPIDIKISEAIMNFQEHNHEISQKIFAGCGKPVLGGGGAGGPFYSPDRSRRSTIDRHQDNDIDDFEIETSYESIPSDDSFFFDSRSLEEPKYSEVNSLYHERSRRDADPEPAAEPEPAAAPAPASSEIDFRPYDFDSQRGPKRRKNKKVNPSGHTGDASEWGGPAMERLVREARARVRNSRRYWAHLPYLLCSDESIAAPPAPHAQCFNGTHIASYTLSAAGEGSAALASNPEIRSGSGAIPSGTVGENALATQQEALRTLTARLKDAYNGVEVQWRDADDLVSASSDLVESAGSGSGSGDDTDDLTDDDEDRHPGSFYPGSGHSPISKEIDNDDEESPIAPVPEAPFTPVVVGGGETKNVHIGVSGVRLADDAPGSNIDRLEGAVGSQEDRHGEIMVGSNIIPEQPIRPSAGSNPGRESPATAAAERPSLQRALFAYALPVVTAWLGGILTDVF